MLRNPFRSLDHKKLRHSSDALKAQNDYYKIVNRRILMFTILIAAVFGVIAVRLVFVQIYDQESYKTKLENYSSQKETESTSRGEMIDRYGNVVAKTVSSHNITYFPPKGATSKEQWALAQKFAKQFKVSGKNMTESDYQDLYIFLHKDSEGKKDGGKHLLKKDEVALDVPKQEKLIRSRITDEMVDELADQETKDAFFVYLTMRKLPTNQNKIVIEDASDNDVAFLTENKEQYQGFNVDLGSWKREYPYGSTLLDVLGGITTTKMGVPAELRSYYEALGYSLTDRVGKSGLEQQYEGLLRGTPKVSDISYDPEDGTAILNETSSGKNGYDLHLTIDIDLQQKIDTIIEDTINQFGGTAKREKFSKASVTLMNPQTGEIYAMSGKYKDEEGTIQNYSSGAYLDTFMSGSVVKGATVYMALEEGIQTKDSIVNDAPIKIAGTPEKGSFKNYGPTNAVRALEVSSNVYMFDSIIKLAGGTYQYNQPLGITSEEFNSAFHLMRNYYSLFGLGTKTLLDVPNEIAGFKANSNSAGRLLDYGIGQFDSYTPMQLLQYVSTIANGGFKIQPKLVNTATEVNTNYVVYENKTNVISKLSGNPDNLATVQQGFRACVVGGHCGNVNLSNVTVAAKTGTAEAGNYSNASLVGYAPYDTEAKVAFVCSAPESSTNDQSVSGNICAYEIMPKVLNEFFKKY